MSAGTAVEPEPSVDAPVVDQRAPTEGGPPVSVYLPWDWSESLAAATPGRRYRVRRILFGLVRDRCHAIAIAEGTELTCGSRRGEDVSVRVAFAPGLPEVERTLEPEFAWFVQIEEA